MLPRENWQFCVKGWVHKQNETPLRSRPSARQGSGAEAEAVKKARFPHVLCGCSMSNGTSVIKEIRLRNFDSYLSMAVGSPPRGATTAGKLRGPRFGSQHWGACAPRPARGRAGVGAGGGRPLPLWGFGCHSRKIFENSDAKSCILVASALISGLPRTCIFEQTSMSKAKYAHTCSFIR